MINLKNLKWTGDLSLQDADVLVEYAKTANSVLEFGAGGSTQLFIQVCNSVTSVETEKNWIDVVKKRINKIDENFTVCFKSFDEPLQTSYDLIFVDGIKQRRFEFATKAWDFLNENGVMLFHDTTKNWGRDLIKNFFISRFESIDSVILNKLASDSKQSNISVFKKRLHKPYVNWQEIENKPKWAYGSDMQVIDVWEYK